MNRERANSAGYSADLTALVILVLMVLWFNHEMVWTGKVPFFRDLGPYFYPMRFNLAGSFQSGELPLWNRHVAMGFPLMANFQSGVFYLPHLLFLLFSFFDAIRFLFVFHYLVAATGSYVLCRRWGYPPYLALLGASLFTFGGMIVSLTNLLDHFQSAAWLPWVLFCGEKLYGSKSWRDFLVLVFVSSLQFLAGSPEIYVLSLGLLLLDGLRIKAEGSATTYTQLFFLPLAANILVAGLCMIQILPTLELFLQSWRSEAVSYEKSTAWSGQPVSLINFFLLDKEINLDSYLGLRGFFVRDIPFFISLYTGAVALHGIFIWFFVSSRRQKMALLALGAVFIIFAVGNSTPVYGVLFKYVPLVSLVRFPEKFLFIVWMLILFMTLSGLFGFVSSSPLPERACKVMLVSPLLLVFFTYLFFRLDMGSLLRLIAWAKQSTPFDVSISEVSSGVLAHMERQLWLTFGVFLLLFLQKTAKLRSTVFGFLLSTLTFMDLSLAHRSYQFLLDPNLAFQMRRVMDPPTTEPYRFFYISDPSFLHPDYHTLNQRSFPETVSSVFGTLLPNTGVFDGFDYMQELDALGRKPYGLFLQIAEKLPAEALYRLLGLMNVSYINSLQVLPAAGITLVRHSPEYPSWLYRIRRVVPRTYVVPKVAVVTDPLKTLERLLSVEFDPFKEVVLGRPLTIPAKKNFHSEAKILNYKNQRVTIHASLSGPGVLVLADSFYPGWRVHVDGKEKEILRANFFFRGVLLEAGEHMVEFQYQPRSFTIGLAISVLTLCGVFGWSIFVLIRHSWRT